ncbi:transposase, partial [Neisseria meningitidis]|uniref:transposase n=1 Tax=Neisseria meningitidis TaxID=487 RepID=UPI0039806A89
MAADRAVPESSKNPLPPRPPRPFRLPAVVHVQSYPLLSMFKAVLLGQWHSLSDPELEHSLITRIDFNLFCR